MRKASRAGLTISMSSGSNLGVFSVELQPLWFGVAFTASLILVCSFLWHGTAVFISVFPPQAQRCKYLVPTLHHCHGHNNDRWTANHWKLLRVVLCMRSCLVLHEQPPSRTAI